MRTGSKNEIKKENRKNEIKKENRKKEAKKNLLKAFQNIRTSLPSPFVTAFS